MLWLFLKTPLWPGYTLYCDWKSPLLVLRAQQLGRIGHSFSESNMQVLKEDIKVGTAWDLESSSRPSFQELYGKGLKIPTHISNHPKLHVPQTRYFTQRFEQHEETPPSYLIISISRLQDPMARRYMSKRYAELMRPSDRPSDSKPSSTRPAASAAAGAATVLPAATMTAVKFPKAELGS